MVFVVEDFSTRFSSCSDLENAGGRSSRVKTQICSHGLGSRESTDSKHRLNGNCPKSVPSRKLREGVAAGGETVGKEVVDINNVSSGQLTVSNVCLTVIYTER